MALRMSSGRVLALKIVKSLLIYSSHPDHKSDPAFLKWPDNSPKTIDYHHLDTQEMIVWMSMELLGSMDVIG